MQTASRMRQVGALLVGHVQSHGGRMPELWEPVYRPTLAQGERRPYGGVEMVGQWWSSQYTYFFAFEQPPDHEMLRAPGHPGPMVNQWQGEAWPLRTEYFVSNAFYAEPAYWNPQTQSGETQFRTQRLDGMRYPAHKVLLFQHSHFLPGDALPRYLWHEEGFENPVLWGDLSYQPIAADDVIPSVVNAWWWERDPMPVLWEPGFLGDGTRDGILGRDR
ncbi:MAG: hypothetical protein ACF8Q5_09395 [Phycisphaerales bacterium JB040]